MTIKDLEQLIESTNYTYKETGIELFYSKSSKCIELYHNDSYKDVIAFGTTAQMFNMIRGISDSFIIWKHHILGGIIPNQTSKSKTTT